LDFDSLKNLNLKLYKLQEITIFMVIGMIAGILAILVGLLVLVWLKVLRIAVGFYFLIWGILQLV